jgi:hypothetical protein
VKGRRRWLRAVTPLAVVVALIAYTITVHVMQQPDPTDRSFLSPTSSAGDGSDLLTQQLSAAGVRVERQTTTPAALVAASTGSPATVLVTTPGLVYPDYLAVLTQLPAGSRIVLVAPDARVIDAVGISAERAGPRWTAAAPAAGCAADIAAGPAAVLRWRYQAKNGNQQRCYDGGVLVTAVNDTTVTLVGAPDAFRNDRADEHANQAFAVGLLSHGARVVWLDLHEHEPPPPGVDEQEQPVQAAPRATQNDPGDDQPGDGRDSQDGGTPSAASALSQAFPPAVWATILLLLLAGVAFAAASARRLGAPVAEPLPVRVRAAETVRGLGGLYRRARARDTSLATLQAAAVRRLADHFGLPPESGTAEVAERVAAYTGQPMDEVRAVLGAAHEGTDRELAAAALAVQRLEQMIDEGNVQ